MTTVLDAYGKPYEPEAPAEPAPAQPQEVALACGACGSMNLYHQTGLGGHWTVICNHCGEEVLRGGPPEPGVQGT